MKPFFFVIGTSDPTRLPLKSEEAVYITGFPEDCKKHHIGGKISTKVKRNTVYSSEDEAWWDLQLIRSDNMYASWYEIWLCQGDKILGRLQERGKENSQKAA